MRHIILFWLFLLLSFAIGTSEIAAQINKTQIYNGMCDASAAVALDENTFIVADDEDNDLRVYDKNNPAELQQLKLSEIFKDKIFDGNNLEIDIEGATWLDDKIFWIGSHSTSKNGKSRPARQRLFALKITRSGTGKFMPAAVGKIYTELIFNLENDTRFKGFKLKEAMGISPKEAGGLSIEGLAATPEGHLLIGFRNPLEGGQLTPEKILAAGKALIVELINPLEVIEGKPAKFAAPITIDLDGLGIRSLEYDKAQKRYLIVAGSYYDNAELPASAQLPSRLYSWSGNRNEKPLFQNKVNLTGFNAEAAFFYPKDKTGFVQLLSDDGGVNCNNSFRGLLQKF